MVKKGKKRRRIIKSKRAFVQHNAEERARIIDRYKRYRETHPDGPESRAIRDFAGVYSKSVNYDLSHYTLAAWIYKDKLKSKDSGNRQVRFSHSQEERNSILEDYHAYRRNNWAGNEDATRRAFCVSYTTARRVEHPETPHYELRPTSMQKWKYKKVKKVLKHPSRTDPPKPAVTSTETDEFKPLDRANIQRQPATRPSTKPATKPDSAPDSTPDSTPKPAPGPAPGPAVIPTPSPNLDPNGPMPQVVGLEGSGATFCCDCEFYHQMKSEEEDLCGAKWAQLRSGGGTSFVRARRYVDPARALCTKVNIIGKCDLFKPKAPSAPAVEKEETKPAAEPKLELETQLEPSTKLNRMINSAIKNSASNVRDPRLPPPGTVLSRSYKGKTYEIKVLENGFQYNGHFFKSISGVTKEITKVVQNGYQFFGPAIKEAMDLH